MTHNRLYDCVIFKTNQVAYDATRDLGLFKTRGQRYKQPTTDQKHKSNPSAIPILQSSYNVNMSNVSHDVMMQQLGNKMLADGRARPN